MNGDIFLNILVLGSDDLWPILLIFSAVPSFLVSFFLPFVPESPRYLLIKKDDEERAKKGKEMTWKNCAGGTVVSACVFHLCVRGLILDIYSCMIITLLTSHI
jgi:hypothetical protein